MKKRLWMAVPVAAMILLLVLIGIRQRKQDTAVQISYNDMMVAVRRGDVAKAVLDGKGRVLLEMRDGSMAEAPDPGHDAFVLSLLETDVEVTEKAVRASLGEGLVMALILLGVFLGWKQRSLGFVRPEKSNVQTCVPILRFEDVAANREAVECMRELVLFLREPALFSQYGARLPRGIMLYGPPGTGKSLLANALAGVAGAPFFSMNGSDFVQVYVGVGASRVRDIFRKARKAGGGVIFIDEIDAIGKKRDSGNDEREQTLNALLTEMSGFSPADGIVVLAATNRLDTLDEALLRAGRFDRHIEVGLPDKQERLKILEVHARNKPMAEDVCLNRLAAETTAFSGAQLESLLNEAAITAARRGEGHILQKDVENAYLKVLVGSEKESLHENAGAEKRITAYHEAGHALLMHLLLPGQKVTRLSILPSTRGAAGYTLSLPEETLFQTRKHLMNTMVTLMGGRAAEKVVFGEDMVTTGAAGDIRRTRMIARRMAEEWEMGTTGDEKRDAKVLFDEASRLAEDMLKEHREMLDLLAERLMNMETMDGKTFLQIMEKACPDTINA